MGRTNRIVSVLGLAGILAAATSSAGCESCGFTFGGAPLRVLVNAPLGYEDFQLRVNGTVMATEMVAPGVYEWEGAASAQSDGPRDCVFVGMDVSLEHPTCQSVDASFAEMAASKDPEERFTTLALSCPPADVPGQIGWWCRSDSECGNDDFICDTSTQQCLPSSCSASTECNRPEPPASQHGETYAPLVCDPLSRSCVASDLCSACSEAEICINATVPGWDRAASRCQLSCELNVPNTCPAQLECVSPRWLLQSAAESEARCKPVGSAEPGAACTSTEVSTGCVAGHVCQLGRCRRQCDLYGDGPTSCDPAQRCALDLTPLDRVGYHPSPTCTTDAIDPAQVGQACTTSAWQCADDGARALGICDEDGMCQGLCLNPTSEAPVCSPCVELPSFPRSDEPDALWTPRVFVCGQ